MYDAIIIGARCAGSPTAMLQAPQGYRVLLVDRATFPSDTMSTHYIHQTGVAQLKRWGLLERVTASNCPPIRQAYLEIGPFESGHHFTLKGAAPPAGDVTEAYCPRRRILDTVLVDAAVAAGTEVREGFLVQEILMEGDRVTGIRGRTRGGAMVMEKARIVVGADGMHSTVARAVQAPKYNEQPSLTCGYYTYWSGFPTEGAELYKMERRYIVVMPTNDNLTCIIACWPNQEFHSYRADIRKNYMKTLELAPRIAQRIHGARQEERFVGTADLPNFFRKPYGPGWALAGDAGYHKDPVTGQGITDAFKSAQLLAEAIDAGFSGRQPLEQAMADYEQKRNEAAMPIYNMNCDMARLEPPPPEMIDLFTALEGDQEETNRFFGAIAGTVPVPEFFAEENIHRIMEEAGLTAPMVA
jgi:flavin-dependent dehydrogenase